jgi:hypothetical protein
MSKPLTALKLKNTRAPAKPVGSRKAFKRLYDSGGLYFEITSNDERWWRLSYPYQGKRKLMSLGVYPTVSLAAARERRDDARRLLARGLDPLAQRQAHKRAAMGRSANSFEAVAREWHGRQAKVWTPKHADDVMRRLEANLFPDLGARPIAEIMAPDLLATARKVEARGAHVLAHRMLGVAGQVFRYGVATGRCERDPSGDLRGALTPHERHNQHAIRPEELPALLKAIDGYTAIGGERQTMLALRLLCLTFVRTNELIGAEWSEVNGLDGATPTWEVPAERMKMGEAHVVPLS